MNCCCLAVAAMGLFVTAGLAAEPPRDFLAEIRAGELKEARASWWGFSPQDATEPLQAAIRSGVATLIVDHVGAPWIVRPIELESNQTLVFEKGVIVEAKRNEFKGRGDCLFRISGKQNVTLRGDGATLRMHRADYDDPALYEKAEWRHVVSVCSSKNVALHGLTLALSGGDGIYLGVSARGVPNENIVIKDVVCDQNYRQGISVIAARNLLIENTVMKNTAGTPPAAGIDFEPNRASEELVNCVMRNCVSENNAGSAYTFYLPNLNAASAPISLRLENCIARNDGRNAFSLTTGNSVAEAVSGRVDVVNCRFERSAGSAIMVRRKPAVGAVLRFDGCVIDRPAPEDAGVVPVVLKGRAGCRRTIGGVDFGDMRLIDPVERPFFSYEDWMGGSHVATVTGTFHIRRGETEIVHPLTREWLTKTFPPRMYKHVPRMSLEGVTFVNAGAAAVATVPQQKTVYLRGAATFVVSAQVGETVALTLRHAQVGRYGGKPLKVVAVSPSGKRIPAGTVAFKETGEIRFKTAEAGLHRIRVDVGSNKIGLVGGSHPVAISGETAPIPFIGVAGELYFLVPAGTRTFGLLIYGESKGEAVKATVFDPAGNQVWEKDGITLPEMFAPEHPPTANDEVWRLRLSRPTDIGCEDNHVDLLGIPPFLAPSPAGLLKAR